MTVSTKVRAFTAHLKYKPKSNYGVIIEKKEPIRFGIQDDCLPTEFVVRFESGETMILPSGALTPLY